MAFATIDMTKGITGTIPVANGGTGLASGTTGQFLKFTGSTTLASNAVDAGITVFDTWRLTSSKTNLPSGGEDITANLGRINSNQGGGALGSAMTESSGIFTFPSTGIYLIQAVGTFERTSSDANYGILQIFTTTDNSSYGRAAEGGETLRNDSASMGQVCIDFLFDVTNTSTHKCKFRTDVSDANVMKLSGNADQNATHFNFMRVGDT